MSDSELCSKTSPLLQFISLVFITSLTYNDTIWLEKFGQKCTCIHAELVLLLQCVQMFWLDLRVLRSSRKSQQPQASFLSSAPLDILLGNVSLYGVWLLDHYPGQPSFLLYLSFLISHVWTYLEECKESLHLSDWLIISCFYILIYLSFLCPFYLHSAVSSMKPMSIVLWMNNHP